MGNAEWMMDGRRAMKNNDDWRRGKDEILT
jgi:hypothetical protein